MSGHSHWAGIKHKKGLADAKRSKTFSKLTKELTIAAKESGADPGANPRLRSIIEKAKEVNMPADTVERAIKKASAPDATQLSEVLLEAYGPGNAALLIEIICDNKNRAMSEIKQILQKNKGKSVEGGAVKWLFERKGVAEVEVNSLASDQRAELELKLIDAGAHDIQWHEEEMRVFTEPQLLERIKEELLHNTLTPQTSLQWAPKEAISLAPQELDALTKLITSLEDHDDVQSVYTNA